MSFFFEKIRPKHDVAVPVQKTTFLGGRWKELHILCYTFCIIWFNLYICDESTLNGTFYSVSDVFLSHWMERL